MTELTVLNGAAIQSLLTIPMAVRAVEQAYLEKSTGGAALWPMVFHEFTPGAADPRRLLRAAPQYAYRLRL